MKERIKRIGVVLLAFCLLLTMLHVAVLAEDALLDIAYSVSGYSGTYDGAAHSIALSVSTEGATVLYAGPTDAEYGSTNPSFTDPGEYTVRYQITANGYNPVEGSETVKISEAEINYEVTYLELGYDGNAHAAGLNVLTDGVTISYSMEENGTYGPTEPKFTNPGSYMVYFRLEKHGYTTETGSAELVIRAIDISEEVEATLPSSFAYTGEPVHFDLPTDKIKEWSVEYWLGDGDLPGPPSDPDDKYYLIASGESDIYCAHIVHKFSIIEYADEIEYTVSGYSGAYDGAAHTIALSVATEGATVCYATSKEGEFSTELPTFTLPGEYTVWFMIEKADCETVLESETVTITPGVIDYSASGYTGASDGKAHTISLSVATPDASVTYATSQDGEYSADKPSFTSVGTHTVWFRIEKEHYATVEGSEVVNICSVAVAEKKTIRYSVEGYVGAYDGEAHTIALDVTTPDVKASYATSEKGAYGAALPTFTEPGTYTVWFKLEKSGFETVTGSATVTIEKAEQTLYFKGTVRLVDPSKNSKTTFLYSSGLKHERGDGALSWSCSDPDRISVSRGDIRTGTLRFDVPYEEWCNGYTATITVTAAETDHYKAATATCTYVFSDIFQASYNQSGGGSLSASKDWNDTYADKNSQNQETLLSTNLDLTILPVTHLDDERLSGVSNELRKKLMASAGSGQIGAMAVNAVLTDTQTGEELHSTNGDLTLSFTGSLGQSYQMNYKNMACIAVHIKPDITPFLTVNIGPDRNHVGQDSTAPAELDVSYDRDNTSASTGDSTVQSYDFTMPTGDVTVHSSFAPMPDSTPAPQDTNVGGAGASSGSSGFTMAGGAIDTSGANSDGSGVYAGPTGFTMAGGTIDTSGANADGSGVNSDSSGIIQIGGSVSMMTTNASDSTPAPQETNAPDTTAASDSTPAPQETNAPDTTVVTVSTAAPMYVNRGINTFGSLKIGEGLYDSGNNSELDESYLRLEGGLRINAGSDDDSSAGSNEGQLVVQRGDLTLVPTGSFSSQIEFIPCELTESGVVIRNTSLSPFLLIYGPKEAFSKLLMVRAKDGVFTFDGEGHAVAAEPSIAEGTSLYYSLDLENWQTEAPAFTDVLWNEDGSVGSYQVYVLADNPDCDPAVCSYTVTILPAA